jgi:hypothetical protein
MAASIRYALLAVCVVLMTGLSAYAENRSFSDLLAQAKVQAAAGHRWSPPGDNATETIMRMIDLIPTATPAQLSELSALIESGKSGPLPTPSKSDLTAEERPAGAATAPPASAPPTPPAIAAPAPSLRRHPGHAWPGHSQPGDAQPGHAQPCHSQPEHSQPGHAQPGHSAWPGLSQPGHSQPGHSQPGHAWPGQIRRRQPSSGAVCPRPRCRTSR